MKMKIIRLLILIGFCTLIPAQDFLFLSEHNIPFSFSERENDRGIAIELLDEILKITNSHETTDNIDFFPWARAYRMVQGNPGTVLFPMARTESRETQFKWVGPIYKLQIGVIARKDAGITIGNVQDLHKYSIGTVRDGAPEQLLIEKGVEKEHLDQAVSIELNLKKLAFGRINLIAYNVPSSMYTLKMMGENPDDYEVVYVIKDLGLYYGFHKSTEDPVIQEMQQALDLIKESGSYDRIVSKYLGSFSD